MSQISRVQKIHNEYCKDMFGKSLADMSDKEICQHYNELNISVNKTECWSTQEKMMYSVMLAELTRREIDIIEDTIFIDKDGNEVLTGD
jgi:hypothetical protein